MIWLWYNIIIYIYKIVLNDLFYAKWKINLDSWGYTRPTEEFWREAIRETKAKYPDIIFLAEVYWGKE